MSSGVPLTQVPQSGGPGQVPSGSQGPYDDGQTNEGAVWLYDGGPGGVGAAPSWSVESNVAQDVLGEALCLADLDGDGIADAVVGDFAYTGALAAEGKVDVYLGSPAGPSAAPDATWTGDQASGDFGSTVAAGDFDGDGYPDLLVASVARDGAWVDGGRVSWFAGSASGPAATAGWTVDGDQTDELLGMSLGSAGDIDGDGFDDVAIGAPNYSNGQTDEGLAEVFLGGPAGPDPTAGWSGESNASYSSYGDALVGLGDVDGDGFGELLVGAPDWSGLNQSSGRIYAYSGSCGGTDADGDGVGDACDACPGMDDALDADADTIPDGCDVCAGGDDRADADADAIADACDDCPAAADPAQADRDGDGLGDACDPLTLSVGAVAAGQVFTATAESAAPGEHVLFFAARGPAGAGPCPANLGGLCLELGLPVDKLGYAVADATGTAVFVASLPASAAAGVTVTVQAAVPRGTGGVHSEASNAVTVVVSP